MISAVNNNNVFDSFQLVTKAPSQAAYTKAASSSSAASTEDKVTLSNAAQQAVAPTSGDVDRDGDNH